MTDAKRIAPVVALVCALHLLVLQPLPGTVAVGGEPAAPAFATRLVMPVPVGPPAAKTATPAARAPSPLHATPRRIEGVRAQLQPLAESAAAPQAPEPTAALGPSEPPLVALSTPGSAPSGGGQTHITRVLPSATLRYQVDLKARGLSLSGHATLTWRLDGDEYDARWEVGAPLLPKRVQTSTGRIAAEGLLPSRFSDKARHEDATHFERDKGKLSFSNNRPDAPLLEGAQDRLSVLLQLSAMVAGEPLNYPPGTAISVPTAGTRESDTWVFTVEGEEDLRLPGGTLRALKLQRLPRKEYDTRVELWLAPGMDYAPVRLRLTNPNGDSVDQRWASTDRD